MQYHWVILASHGRERARQRLRYAVAASCVRQLGQKRRLSAAAAILNNNSLKKDSRGHCETSKLRYFHASNPHARHRPLHTTPPKPAPHAAAVINEQQERDNIGPHVLSDTPSDSSEHESWLNSSSATPLDYEVGEASLWDACEDQDFFGDEGHDASTLEPPKRAKQRTAREMLQSFDPQNPPSKDNLEELQLWFEVQAQQESVEKYENILNHARDRKDFASLGLVQKQVLKWYQVLKEEIENEQRRYMLEKLVDIPNGLRTYGPYLCSLQPEKLAVITAHVALVQSMLKAGENLSVLFLAKQIGNAVECEVNVQRAVRKMLEESRLKMQQDWETEQRLDEGEEETDQVAIDTWTYGPSHLKKFLEDTRKPDGRKSHKSVYTANRRARRILNIREYWNEGHKIKLGVALLEILLSTATLDDEAEESEKAFQYEKKIDFEKAKWGRKQGVITLHEKLYHLLTQDKSRSFEAMSDRYKPMILPPRPWTAPTDGAYSWLKVSLMRTEDCNTQKDALREVDLTTAFDALNALGRVPWVINRKILDAAQQCWKSNIALGDIPSRVDLPLPSLPSDLDRSSWVDDKESDEYKRQGEQLRAYREELGRYRRVYQKNMDLRSLRCSAVLKLDQAEQFKEFEKIYFPYNMDFRGRAYPIPPHLSTVGSDMCRGMLVFAESKPLGDRGLYWLKVHLANLAGNDKMSFDGRADFTDQNMANVRAAVADPFGENQWWMTLDDPFQGLATCHEIVNAIDSGDPPSYKCSLPVHMDGSCNGLQHYAALGRDKAGGSAVNLCYSEKPSDVYIGVRDEVVKRVAEEAAKVLNIDESKWDDLAKEERNSLLRNRSAKLVNGLIDRGVVKRTVMTSVYGVTYIGARKQIQEKIVEKLEDKGYDVFENEDRVHEACGYLASVTMEVMGDLFSGARQTMSWLATCARLIAQQDQPVSWFTPLGIPVVQPYRQRKMATIQTVLQQLVLVDQQDDLPVHKGRQATAFPPNYVHSLDSSHMMLTAIEMDKRGLTFSAVHDSFWTHPCDIDEMNAALRDTFVHLYEQPLLEELKESWEIRYPSIEFPDIPEKGSLDLNEVKSAPYFFQ